MKRLLIILVLCALGTSYIAQVKLLVEKIEVEETQPALMEDQEQEQGHKKTKDNLPGYPPPPDDSDYPYPPPPSGDPIPTAIPLPTWTPRPLPTPAPTMDPEIP
jgi:hypothetical protein